MFRVAWEDAAQPDKGFKYLYITDDDLQSLRAAGHAGALRTEPIVEPNPSGDASEGVCHRICDLIGSQDGIGVENLRLAGMIAAETSRAYDDIVTVSMVTCRAIGIGSYLLRLGQRVVQVDNSHIILTGHAALNKVLGRNVYSSNDQLGGVQIMFNNGVAHKTEPNDAEAIYRMLHWLSYVPARMDGPLPMVVPSDAVERPVECGGGSGGAGFEVRELLAGKVDVANGRWLGGMFDADSWTEIMQQWAQTVVVGRARLGGIPVGVVAAETRTVEFTVPADPANVASEATVSVGEHE